MVNAHISTVLVGDGPLENRPTRTFGNRTCLIEANVCCSHILIILGHVHNTSDFGAVELFRYEGAPLEEGRWSHGGAFKEALEDDWKAPKPSAPSELQKSSAWVTEPTVSG